MTHSLYFSPNCIYTYLRKSKASKDASTGLPSWMIYHEYNNTLYVYPPSVQSVELEYICCNAIEECATMTFIVTSKDTSPTVSLTTSNYVIQYDTTANVG